MWVLLKLLTVMSKINKNNKLPTVFNRVFVGKLTSFSHSCIIKLSLGYKYMVAQMAI